MKKWFQLILIWCFSSYSIAQSQIDQIEELVSFCQENGMFNGSVLIAENSKIIYHRSIGLADFDKDLPLNNNTSFCLGSISKQFTAFAIMLLENEGKIEYTSTVGDIFPELPHHMHEITLLDLMQHKSGLKRTHYGDQEGLTNEEIFVNFRNAKNDTLLFQPGADLRYSNSGYMLLAMIVEKVSGQNFELFLQENVWQPLGMTNTFVMSESDSTRANRAIGFDGFGMKSDFNVLTYGSNGIYSSAEDLYRWSQSFNTDVLIPFEKKSMAWKPAVSLKGELLEDGFMNHTWNYGFGYFIYIDALKGVVGHSGAFGGFLNLMMHDFSHNRDLIILTNNGRLIPVHDFHMAVQDILNGRSFTFPQISIHWKLRNEFYNDIDSAIATYKQLKKEHPNKYKFNNEWELNNLGYALIGDKRFKDAVKILKLLVSEFPEQPNPHDSLGEAYFLNGQYELSIESYQNAMRIDHDYNAEWIRDMIKKNKEKLAANK